MVSAPLGYEAPSFPSLYWPLGATSDSFNNSFLYYTKDVWMFTTVWSIVLVTGFYTSAAIIIVLTHYKAIDYQEVVDNNQERGLMKRRTHFIGRMLSNNKKFLVNVIMVYILMGALQGFISGSIVGVLIAAIYNSAQFRVTTWIPFVYGIVITLFNVTTSYSFTVDFL